MQPQKDHYLNRNRALLGILNALPIGLFLWFLIFLALGWI